jgi:AraC family transcriptional regulator
MRQTKTATDIRRDSRKVCGLTLSEVMFPPLLVLPKHSHETACFGLTLRGAMVEAFGSRGLQCTPSTVLARPSREEHADRVSPAGAKVFAVEMSESWVAHVREHGKVLGDPLLHSPGELTRLMKSIYREVRRDDDASPLAVQSLAFEIASHLVRESVREQHPHAPAWLKRVKDRLDACYSESLMLTELARDAGVHSVHLSRSFRRHFSVSVGEYLRHRRVRAAAREIENGEGSLADIALRAGFSSQSHFCSVFRQVTGRTPSEFRRSAR